MKTMSTHSAPSVRAVAAGNPRTATYTFPNRTRMPSKGVALLAMAGLAASAMAGQWHWNAAGGNWSQAAKWSPLSVPAPGGDVFIGSTAAAENATVLLDLDRTVASLSITDGMTATNLATAAYVVDGDTVVSGMNIVAGPFGLLTEFPSRLLLEAVDGTTLWTDNLILSDGGRAVLDNAFVRVEGATTIDAESRLQGLGFVDSIGGGVKVRNDGVIRSTDTVFGLRFRQFDDGTYDLDGLSGDGVLDLSTVQGARMEFQGVGLADAFSGVINMRWDAELVMDLANGWTADANALIDVETANFGYSVIDGTAFALGGDLSIGKGSGWLGISSDQITFLSTANVQIATNNALEVGGGGDTAAVVIEGGAFTLAQFGNVNFHAPTIVRGGTFNTFSSNPGQGSIDFYGLTEFDGDVTFNGSAVQYGDATVSGASVITADTFDMSGAADTSWQINDSLTINADSLASSGASEVSADIAIANGFSPRLTINLTAGAWVHTGALNLTGSPLLSIDRVAGTGVEFHGEINLPSGKATISADAMISANAKVDLGAPSADLRLTGDTWIQPADFFGQGTLRNGSSGDMTLSDGLSLGQVGFVNEGEFQIGVGESSISAGLATVDRFINASDAVWNLTIGGHIAGSEHDLLMVTGEGVELGGTLKVRLADLGAGTFIPAVGDEFLILVSLGEVAGAFTTDPVTHLGDLTYQWSVLYGSNTVSLRLDNVIPTPGSIALMGLGGLIAARRRRA